MGEVAEAQPARPGGDDRGRVERTKFVRANSFVQVLGRLVPTRRREKRPIFSLSRDEVIHRLWIDDDPGLPITLPRAGASPVLWRRRLASHAGIEREGDA